MISACLLLHNDHDILASAVESVSRFADGIVVVDGAYDWLAPLLGPSGLPTDRSTDECLDILHRSDLSGKIRYFSGTWANELEKRTFAYEQCKHDLVHLVDADEIHVLDDDELRRFLSSDRVVARMSAPLLATDALASRRRADPHAGLPPKPMLFKKDRVGAREHLAYLWLVLHQAEQALLAPQQPELIHEAPVGRMFHLSNLRTLDTGVHRCRFYVFNWIRENGRIPWLPELELGPGAELSKIYELLSPDELDRSLRGNPVALGFLEDESVEYFPFSVDEAWTPAVRAAFGAFRASMGATARDGTALLLNGSTFVFDVTDHVTSRAQFNLRFDQPVASAAVECISLTPTGLVRRKAFRGNLGRAELECELQCADGAVPPFRVLASVTAWMPRPRPPPIALTFQLNG